MATFDDFVKLDIRAGTVLIAKALKKQRSLLINWR